MAMDEIALEIGLQDVLSEFNFEEIEIDVEILPATTTSSNVNDGLRFVDESVTRQVFDTISPFLDEDVIRLSSIDVAQLTASLKVLHPHLQQNAGVFVAANREKSWSAFHQHQDEIVSSIDTHVHNKIVSSLIALKTMELLLCPKTIPSSAGNVSEVTDDEKDILYYVGGFTLFRCKNLLKDPLSSSVINQLVETGEIKTKLISTKTRGGLCEPNESMRTFFVLSEVVFRESFHCSAPNNDQSFLDKVCGEEDILSLFYTSTYDCDDYDTKVCVLYTIIRIFFKVRCHAKCRHLMEKYRSKTKTNRKEKALRKKLTE